LVTALWIAALSYSDPTDSIISYGSNIFHLRPFYLGPLFQEHSHGVKQEFGECYYDVLHIVMCKGTGKLHPITGQEGTEVENSYSSTLSLT
jgi:hypothetical protein